MGEEMRQLCARLDAIKIVKRRETEVGNVSETQIEEVEEEVVVCEKQQRSDY